MITVSLVVPAFNEGQRIKDSLLRLDQAFAERVDLDTEIVLVNDGSSDDTLDVLLQVVPTLKNQVVVLTHDVNQGLGGALRSGFAHTRGELVVAVDSDLSYGISDLFAIIDKAIETGVHVVIASPYMPGGRSVAVPRSLDSRSRLANKILGRASINGVHTVTGMVRAYNGEHIRSMSLKAVDIDINSEIIYKTELLRGSIVEVPATLDWSSMQERAGRSKISSKRSRWNTAKALVNAFLFRPFMVPLMFIPIVLLVGMVCGIWVDGSARVSVFMASFALIVLLTLFSLLMLQLKRYFEETYSAISRVGRATDHPTHAHVVLNHRP